MALGEDTRDALAYELVQSDFDAAERETYRATWTADNTTVVVTDMETGETCRYRADDLLRAASDREVHNAREVGDEIR